VSHPSFPSLFLGQARRIRVGGYKPNENGIKRRLKRGLLEGNKPFPQRLRKPVAKYPPLWWDGFPWLLLKPFQQPSERIFPHVLIEQASNNTTTTTTTTKESE